MARAIIVGGGAFDAALLPAYTPGDLLIAADSGLLHLQRAGRQPDVCIGDWDSLPAPPSGGEIVTLPVAKDDTDLVAGARLALARGYRELILLGALGGRRFSHSLAAVQLLHWLCAQGADAVLRDRCCSMRALCTGSAAEFPATARGHLSVFALTDRAVVSLEGLWYARAHLELTNRFPLGVSNAFLGQRACVRVEEGVTLLMEEPES